MLFNVNFYYIFLSDVLNDFQIIMVNVRREFDLFPQLKGKLPNIFFIIYELIIHAHAY